MRYSRAARDAGAEIAAALYLSGGPWTQVVGCSANRACAIACRSMRGTWSAQGLTRVHRDATVKTYLLHISAKLGVNDRAAVVAAAFERGLLTSGQRAKLRTSYIPNSHGRNFFGGCGRVRRSPRSEQSWPVHVPVRQQALMWQKRRCSVCGIRNSRKLSESFTDRVSRWRAVVDRARRLGNSRKETPCCR